MSLPFTVFDFSLQVFAGRVADLTIPLAGVRHVLTDQLPSLRVVVSRSGCQHGQEFGQPLIPSYANPQLVHRDWLYRLTAFLNVQT